MLCSDFPPGFCTIPRHSTALAKSAEPLSFGVNGHTQLGNLIKMSLGKKKTNRNRITHSAESHTKVTMMGQVGQVLVTRIILISAEGSH